MCFRPTFASVTFPLMVLLSTLAASVQAQNMDVRVINRSSQDVVAIYVSPTNSPYHGTRDLLGRMVLDSGYNVVLDFNNRDAKGNCVLDVVARGSDGGRWSRRMNACSVTSWTLND